MSHRKFVFHDNKPQVDHIFPVSLKGIDDEYRESVDVLWNLQPIAADINSYKRARHPKEFFMGEGNKYFDHYDFLPEINSKKWDDHKALIAFRETQMRSKLHQKYKLKLWKDSDYEG